MSRRSGMDYESVVASRQTDRESRRERPDYVAPMERIDADEGRMSGGGRSLDIKKYTIGAFGALFAIMLVVSFYLKEDAKRTRQISQASLVFLGLAALLCAYKGLYLSYDKKNVYTVFTGIFAVIFLAQAYYVKEAYDDVEGAASPEQEQANTLTYVGAIAGVIGASYVLYKKL